MTLRLTPTTRTGELPKNGKAYDVRAYAHSYLKSRHRSPQIFILEDKQTDLVSQTAPIMTTRGSCSHPSPPLAQNPSFNFHTSKAIHGNLGIPSLPLPLPSKTRNATHLAYASVRRGPSAHHMRSQTGRISVTHSVILTVRSRHPSHRFDFWV